MKKETRHKLLVFAGAIILPLAVGAIASLLTRDAQKSFYDTIIEPSLSPPMWVFPVVWTILYVLMGISSYLVFESHSEHKKTGLIFYAVQLALNFGWTLVFFLAQNFLLSFIWIIVLWFFILLMIIEFYRAKPLSAYLQIPYILWVTFAAYLTLMIYLLN